MKHRPIVLSISIAIVVMATSSFASRSALGLVIDACKVNSLVTGSPYPCYKVVQAQSPLSSYAILREPSHKERTVLAPLADVSGIEDPRLLATDAPNYFNDAWKERSAATALRAEDTAPKDFALAINAATWRTQDRLHIHMGCATPRFRAVLISHQSDISGARFTSLRNNAGWWVRYYPVADLSHLDPIKAVADGVDGAKSNMMNVMIGVFSASLEGGRPGLYILTRIIGAGKANGSAEDMIDPKCLS